MSSQGNTITRLGKKIFSALCSPGRQYSIKSAAPTQFITTNKLELVDITEQEFPTSYAVKKSLGSRFFDSITKHAGSKVIFLITLIILVAWAIVGIVLGAPPNWQIAMQDGSSIQCYISDSLLMRQQQNHCNDLLTIIAQLRSRNSTLKRLLRNTRIDKNSTVLHINNLQMHEDNVGDAAKLPVENWFDICCNWVSNAVGSIYALIIYWMGIFVWIGTGYLLQWSNMWQLYINTGTAVELTFTCMFLQHTRRHHMEYLEKCLASVKKADCELETLLRQYTGDNEPNPIIEIEPLKVTRAVRSIDYYADVVGTGVGAAICVSVFVIWIAIGNIMQWDSNWWLIIGTYTGLIGFIDGFVLRNVYFRQDKIMDEQFNLLIDADSDIFQYLNLQLPTKPLSGKKSFICLVSYYMGVICSMPEAVLASFIIVLALLCIASGMHWNETGQLLCNTPTMIIEGFLLIVLIQAHNISNTKRRVQLHDILIRRLTLLQCVKQIVGNGESKGFNEKEIPVLERKIKNLSKC
ncbi:low-affinity Fe(2+) transport protein [Basidiobolus ranarum]|uniref:Low-affinity Fe(2+) transport protein n=1 Tax=Basidiobolus ranarum TaxID=34480 RepID=A0ABR2VX91_9FUNG